MTNSLRILYAGTPAFAVPALDALRCSRHRVVAVYTQPDRPAGRGQKLAPGAVKQYAAQHALPIEQPPNFRSAEALETLAGYAPDLMIVAAYGLLLPQAVLDLPRFGCVNIHASLLPRWRGAAPIQRAILAGDATTGVTLMLMEAGLDTGPMLGARATPIRATDNAARLHDRLAELGAQALLEMLDDLPPALAQARAQPEDGVTYAKKLSKDEAPIDWSRPAVEIDRQIRAFNPWPVAETRLAGVQLRVWEAELCGGSSSFTPGTVLDFDDAGIRVVTGDGLLCLTQVQLAGRKALPAAEFVKAHALSGAVLGQ